MSTRPCQTTPEGSIYPGRPGESLEDFMARRAAEWDAAWDGNSADAAPPSSRQGFYEHGRG